MQDTVYFGNKPLTGILGPGNVLTFSGSGSAVCRVVGATLTDYPVGSGAVVGPFLRQVAVIVWSVSGELSVTETASSELDKVFQAPVSGAGNQPSATLAATTGTPGQIVRLSDGADAGALLVWAIPAGSSTYTWCWWLWPQSAY